MKTHTLGACAIALAGSLLLASCAQHEQYAYVKRTPNSQNVHQYAGGEVLRQYQERSGIGTMSGADNALGSRP
ncbi:MAG: hypothetical protein ACJ8KU_08135 [Chthoniobacterales bacterium]